MIEFKRIAPALFIPVFALIIAAAPLVGDDDDDDDDKLQLDEAEVFIEFNSTDGDFGIQFFWDGEPWYRMTVEGPDPEEARVLKVKVTDALAKQGMTEGFFESAEPSSKDLPMDEFLARFPEGEYDFDGITLEGEEIEGETEFTHVLPAPPENLWPADGDEIDPDSRLVVSFDAVTEDLDGNPLEPELYEVIVETEGDILRVFSMTLDGDTRRPLVRIPPQFIDEDTEYKFEVIVQEESGNRTISETEFCTTGK